MSLETTTPESDTSKRERHDALVITHDLIDRIRANTSLMLVLQKYSIGDSKDERHKTYEAIQKALGSVTAVHQVIANLGKIVSPRTKIASPHAFH